MGRFFAGTRGPAGLWRRRRLKQIFDSGASLRLQFPKEDLGFAYPQGGAAVAVSEDAVQRLLQGQHMQVRTGLSCNVLPDKLGAGALMPYLLTAPHCQPLITTCTRAGPVVQPAAGDQGQAAAPTRGPCSTPCALCARGQAWLSPAALRPAGPTRPGVFPGRLRWSSARRPDRQHPAERTRQVRMDTFRQRGLGLGSRLDAQRVRAA